MSKDKTLDDDEIDDESDVLPQHEASKLLRKTHHLDLHESFDSDHIPDQDLPKSGA